MLKLEIIQKKKKSLYFRKEITGEGEKGVNMIKIFYIYIKLSKNKLYLIKSLECRKKNLYSNPRPQVTY